MKTGKRELNEEENDDDDRKKLKSLSNIDLSINKNSQQFRSCGEKSKLCVSGGGGQKGDLSIKHPKLSEVTDDSFIIRL